MGEGEKLGSKFFRDYSRLSEVYTAPHPRRGYSQVMTESEVKLVSRIFGADRDNLRG
jgi:hypothetical protein